MRKTSILMAAVALTAVSSASLAAQAAPDRTGFYADIGANYTWPSNKIEVSGFGSATDKASDIGYTLGLGLGLKSNKVRLGLQVDYFVKNDFGGVPSLKSQVEFLTAAIAFYPPSEKSSVMKDSWVKVNLGYGQEELSVPGSSGTGGGFAAGIAVGRDVRLGSGGFVIAPYIAFMDLFKTGDFGGDLSGSGTTAAVSMFQIGLTLGYKH